MYMCTCSSEWNLIFVNTLNRVKTDKNGAKMNRARETRFMPVPYITA